VRSRLARDFARLSLLEQFAPMLVMPQSARKRHVGSVVTWLGLPGQGLGQDAQATLRAFLDAICSDDCSIPLGRTPNTHTLTRGFGSWALT
jgi:hypothetical protein